MSSFRKPAEVYFDDAMVTAYHVEPQMGYLYVRMGPDGVGEYYPWHRIKRVVRLPNTDTDPSSGNSEGTPSASAQSDTDAVRAWVESLGIPSNEMEVYEHTQFGSINIEPDGQVDWWQDLTNAVQDLENAWWDGEDRVWVIRDVAEVVE